jgi:hypothetical protein
MGFYPTGAPAKPYGDRGLHAGYNNNWRRGTGGCIRTTREGMSLFNGLNDTDRLQWLVCTWEKFYDDEGFIDLNEIDRAIAFHMRARHIPQRIVDKICDTIWNYLSELYYGQLNFLMDYWFNSESPIPPWAQ